MKIDSAIKDFSEKYDRDAIQSIDNISKDYALKISESTIKVFNLVESFDIFSKYLKGYSTYKLENVNNPESSSQDTIKESVKKFIDTKIFTETEIKYSALPSFIKGYFEGVNLLIETVDNIKRNMIDCDVDSEDIGDINEFVDMFMDKFNESFYPTMDRILWASGYNSKKKLYDRETKSIPAPVFL